jgi:Mrp family chromosome partitioning ATPase
MPNQEEAGPIRWPFDPLSVLLGALRHWFLFVVIVILGVALGVLAGYTLGRQEFSAETVLLYRQSAAVAETGDYVEPPLTTQLNLVKVPANLEEVRRLLHLPCTLGQLGGACTVMVQSKTNLMSLRVRWENGEQAAAIATSLRDVFLESRRRLRREEMTAMVGDLEARLETVEKRLRLADDAMQKFTAAKHVVDLDKETLNALQELSTLDLLFEQAEADRKTIGLQAANIDRITADLAQRAQAEKQQAAGAATESLTYTNMRLQRLREAIVDNKEYRANLAALAEAEAELERAKKLRAGNLIAEAEYTRVLADYERQKVLTVDTDEIKAWKSQIQDLDKVVIPTDSTPTASDRVLQDMTMRSFDIQLQKVALEEKGKHYADARERVQVRLDTLPALQREFAMLRRETGAAETEKNIIEGMLARARRAQDAETGSFITVSEARAPGRPSTSSRRLVCLAVCGLGVALAGLVAVGLEVVKTSVRGLRDFRVRFTAAPLLVLPRLPAGSDALPVQDGSVLLEPFRMLARRVRVLAPQQGTRLLVASAGPGEGRTSVAASLAACLGRLDERVLLIDAQVRPDVTGSGFADLLPGRALPRLGLSEYLTNRALTPEEVVVATILPGVACIPRVGATDLPDLLGTGRMGDLLAWASAHYSITIIDPPPVWPWVDADLVAKWVDGVLWVVRCGGASGARLRETETRIIGWGKPLLGAVVNAPDPVYSEGPAFLRRWRQGG